MKVLALIWSDESNWDRLSEDERKEWYGKYRSFSEAADGKLAGGDELAPTQAATTVRVRDGETVVTDGPFAETREQLGGYFVLDVESLDEATELAAKIPGAWHGSVELRAGSGGGGVMKYLLLLNNDGAAVDSWRELSAEEAAARRAEEIPRWNALFGWAGEQGIDLDGLELDDPDKATRRPRPRRRDDGHRRPVRRDEGADRRLLRRRLQGPRPGDRARAAHPVVTTGSVEIRPIAE